MKEIYIGDKWHPMGVCFDGKRGLGIAVSANYGLEGTGGLRMIKDVQQPNSFVEWSAPTAIYDVKTTNLYYFAAGADGFVYQVNQQGHLINRIKAHEREINRLSVNGNLIASASWDGHIGLIDMQNLRFSKFRASDSAINEVAIHPNGYLVACASMSGPVTLWDLRNRKIVSKVSVRDAPLSIKFSPDGSRLAFAGIDNDINVIEVPSMRQLRIMNGHYRTIRQLTWLGRDEILSVGYDMSVRWWNVTKENCLIKSDCHFTEFVVSCDSLHRNAVVASWDGKVTIYE